MVKKKVDKQFKKTADKEKQSAKEKTIKITFDIFTKKITKTDFDGQEGAVVYHILHNLTDAMLIDSAVNLSMQMVEARERAIFQKLQEEEQKELKKIEPA